MNPRRYPPHKLKTNLLVDLKNKIKQIELELQRVNERWHTDSIELSRSHFKGRNEKVYDKKTMQLSARQAFDKAIPAVKTALGKVKKTDIKSQQALYTAIQDVYNNDELGEAVIKVHISFNGNCGSCYDKLKRTAENMLKENKESQLEYIQHRIDKIEELESQIMLLESELKDQKAKAKPAKRGRPKKTTTHMVKESGEND